MPTKLTIGRLAKAAGVTVETIRYYQNRSLIQEPIKPLEGFREYPREYINRIKFIKQAQKLNFSLEEIAQLLKLGSEQCEDVKELAIRKREILRSKLNELAKLTVILDRFIEECDHHDPNDTHCVLLEEIFHFE